MIRHRCPACHHMMDSSPHLVGVTVHCHVCREPLVVPDKSSGESGSFVRAHAHGSSQTGAATLPVSAGAEGPTAEGREDALADLIPKSPRARAVAGALIGVIVAVAASAAAWWVFGR